jgi:hypothetical protein
MHMDITICACKYLLIIISYCAYKYIYVCIFNKNEFLCFLNLILPFTSYNNDLKGCLQPDESKRFTWD